MKDIQALKALARLVRYWILLSTTKAGSGHPTSSLSATDLMTTLMFGGFFRFDAKNPEYYNNDRLLFSKGHAAPLLYALWAAAGEVSEADLLTLRKFGSPFEGHPTMVFPFTEAATGSLGQGLSVGVGMALNAKYIDKLPYKTFVLLGDSEMAEGSIWEAVQLAAHYKLDNLVGILDMNRLGQSGETMYGHSHQAFKKRLEGFGWKTLVTDGHNIAKIITAYKKAMTAGPKPTMIIAKTIKGKGVPAIENKNNWHGKPLSEELFDEAVKSLGRIDTSLQGRILAPRKKQPRVPIVKKASAVFSYKKALATRKAYGQALVRIYPWYPQIVALDAEVKNSTYAETFASAYPQRFFEMYIAEQNMVGTALGFSRMKKIPFVSTFAAFFTRAFDQIRMSAYSKANIKFVGSHGGVSIGQDGVSQMGLEDIAMFRSVFDSVVLYPSDAVSTDKLVEAAAEHQGIVYLRTTRADAPILYSAKERFFIGGSKIVKRNVNDCVTVVAAGVTLHEALDAYAKLKKEGIYIRVIDLYSIKPIDAKTLKIAAQQTRAIVTVEDHYPEGGLGEAVMSVFANPPVPIVQLAVRKMPRSGQAQELLDYEHISASAIYQTVRNLI